MHLIGFWLVPMQEQAKEKQTKNSVKKSLQYHQNQIMQLHI